MGNSTAEKSRVRWKKSENLRFVGYIPAFPGYTLYVGIIRPVNSNDSFWSYQHAKGCITDIQPDSRFLERCKTSRQAKARCCFDFHKRMKREGVTPKT